MRLFCPAIITLCLLVGVPKPVYSADVPVSLELITQRGFPVDGQQRWIKFLQGFGFTSVRIARSSFSSSEPSIENRGSDNAPRYTVTGILSASSGRLLLPGITVRYGQRSGLTTWLDKLRRGGAEAITAPTGLFGLTAKQFATLIEPLKQPIALRTKGKPARDVLQHIQRSLPFNVEIDASALQAIPSDSKVFDELHGLSRGTALAAIARPYGLCLTPTGQGTRTVGLRIAKSVKPDDAWPIGSSVKGGVADVAPALLKFVSVEIVEQPLDDTLNTIQERLKIPFLYDYDALERNKIDLHETVSLPRKKTFYKKVLDLLLFQKLLVAELRQDEAGAPFLWITSAKR